MVPFIFVRKIIVAFKMPMLYNLSQAKTDYTMRGMKFMQFATIASGSSGNCLYAGNDDTHILIDTGISKKRIEEGLRQCRVDARDIDAVLITHEHADHIQGIGVWSRKYHVPIYATRGTLNEIKRAKSLGAIDESLFHVIRPEEEFTIKNVRVRPFAIPHDARDPVSYHLEDDANRIGMVTDLGYFDRSIVDALLESDLLYVEANHDLRMLETGPYPYALKRRIAGNYGHLCNEMSGQLIGQLLNERLQYVILGHLSKENNFPDLALQAVKNELSKDFSVTENTLNISVAPRDHAMSVITL